MSITELSHPAIVDRDVGWIQWELFVFEDVRDVLPSTRPDTVLVVHRGPARVEAWTAALTGALAEWGATSRTG